MNQTQKKALDHVKKTYPGAIVDHPGDGNITLVHLDNPDHATLAKRRANPIGTVAEDDCPMCREMVAETMAHGAVVIIDGPQVMVLNGNQLAAFGGPKKS